MRGSVFAGASMPYHKSVSNPARPGVSATAGTFGTATQVPVVTVDAKGRITASGSTPITFPVNSVAGRTGNVTLSVNDISGLGTLAQQNTNALALTGTVSSSAATTTHKYPITINGTTYYLLLSNV